MAATTETVLPRYYVLSPVKAGDRLYKVGEAVPLDADEAKLLAADGIIEAKPIADGIIEAKPIKVKADKSPASDEQTRAEE